MVTKDHSKITSIVLNTVAADVTGQGGPVWPQASFTAWEAVQRLNLSEMKLTDVANFDFRPAAGSPLRRAGMVHEPEVQHGRMGRPRMWERMMATTQIRGCLPPSTHAVRHHRRRGGHLPDTAATYIRLLTPPGPKPVATVTSSLK